MKPKLKRYTVKNITYICIWIGYLFSSMVFAVDVNQINQIAETECNNAEPNSDKVILCAIWLNSLPVVPVHETSNKNILLCDSLECTAEEALQICKSLEYKRVIRYSESKGFQSITPLGEGAPILPTRNGSFAQLWCQ